MDTIDEFVAVMRLSLKTITIATMLDDSNISKQIYEYYLNEFESSIVPVPIRTSSKGQAAQLYGQSIFEYAPTSSLALDYKNVIMKIWRSLGNECPSGHFVDMCNDDD
jgi:cellulose biosynthesis protein BcsQ